MLCVSIDFVPSCTPYLINHRSNHFRSPPSHAPFVSFQPPRGVSENTKTQPFFNILLNFQILCFFLWSSNIKVRFFTIPTSFFAHKSYNIASLSQFLISGSSIFIKFYVFFVSLCLLHIDPWTSRACGYVNCLGFRI